MNKNLSILTVTIALIGCMVVFLSSCTDTYDEDVMGKIRQTPENTLSTNTARELQHFNDGLESSMTQTRGTIRNLYIVYCDAVGAGKGAYKGARYGSYIPGNNASAWGALVGGLVYGAYGSYKAYRKTQPVLEHEVDVYDKTWDYCNSKVSSSEDITFDIPQDDVMNSIAISSTYSDILKIGNMHNELVSEMCATDNGISLLSDDLDPFEPLQPVINPTLDNFFTNRNFLGSFNHNKVEFENSFSGSYFDVEEYVGTSGCPLEMNEILLLFLNATSNVQPSTDNYLYIVNNYIQTIENSTELSTDEKLSLYISFVVFIYSNILWESFL